MWYVYEELTRFGWQSIFVFHARTPVQADRYAASYGRGGTLPYRVRPRLAATSPLQQQRRELISA